MGDLRVEIGASDSLVSRVSRKGKPLSIPTLFLGLDGVWIEGLDHAQCASLSVYMVLLLMLV
jgi:hypothetical protein